MREQLGITETPRWHAIAEKRATFSCEVNLSCPAHATLLPICWQETSLLATIPPRWRARWSDTLCQ
jgi:hypothetical protein